MATKAKKSETKSTPIKSSDNSLPIISVVLGAVSLLGPGLLLGIPAIIVGSIALKKQQGERGISITGIVTGALSTLFSLFIIALIIWGIVWGINHPEDMRDQRTPIQEQQRDRFDLQRS